MITLIKRLLRPLKEGVLVWLDRRQFNRQRRRAKRGNAGKPLNPAYDWVILCVKRPVYVNLVRDNINSLHIHNPGHRLTVLCDTACETHLRQLAFDYPGQVTIENRFGDDERPWQFLKLEALAYAATHQAILVDADTRWWSDPRLPEAGVVFQVANRRFVDWPNESFMLDELFPGRDWAGLTHYVTGLVRIPAGVWTEELRRHIAQVAESIWTWPGTEGMGDDAIQAVRRLCEEIAIGLSLQVFFPDQIRTLKSADPYQDRTVMESLYYGAINKV